MPFLFKYSIIEIIVSKNSCSAFSKSFSCSFIILLPSENLLPTTGAIIVEEALIIQQFVYQKQSTAYEAH
jgi:hypothetical protein